SRASTSWSTGRSVSIHPGRGTKTAEPGSAGSLLKESGDIVTTHYTTDSDSKAVAAALLDAGCVAARTDEPFRLPSGWASPVYIDCRRFISFPALRRDIVSRAQALLSARGALEGVASIVGGEASGIALAARL